MSLVERSGYIETKVGWIPNTWLIRSLENISTDNITYGVVQPGPEDENGVPLVRGGDIKDGRISNTLRTISSAVSKQFSRTVLRGGELLVSLVGYPGETAIAGNELIGANIARQVGLIRLDETVSSEFVQQYLSSSIGKRILLGGMIGSAQQVINLNALREVDVLVPPLSEQRKIAAILTSVDDKLDVITRQIKATQTLKRGLMQTLFSRGVGIQDAAGRWAPHVEFKDSPIGKIPQNWDSKILEDLSVENITYGVVQPGENLEGGVPLIRGGDIKGGNISRKLRTVSVEISNQFKRTVLCGGELLVSLVGYPGETAVVPDKLVGANIARQVGMVRTGSRAMSEFIHCYLSSPTGKKCLLGGMIGSAQQVINLKSLREVYVPMPPEIERMQIISVCQSIFDKLDALEKKKGYYQNLKRGLIQKLLTGEWRVKLDSPTSTSTA